MRLKKKTKGKPEPIRNKMVRNLNDDEFLGGLAISVAIVGCDLYRTNTAQVINTDKYNAN